VSVGCADTAPDALVRIHGGDYEHTFTIGGTTTGGARIAYESMHVRDIFVGMLENRSYEICEFSAANYMTLRGRGETWLKAIAVFPYRAFRHSFAITRRDSPIESLAQLAGKRIGVDDYSMTAAVWFRGLLADEHGIDHRDITWTTPRKQRFPFPSDARVETTDADLEGLLCGGQIDVLLGFKLRDQALPAAERRLRPVLRDAQADEAEYYRRTSVYPIMHCVVIRSDVLERHPGIETDVAQAYADAKARAYQRQLGTTLAPWAKAHWTRSFELFGGDPLPYGTTPVNRMVLEKLAGYLRQQGFIESAPPVEEIFLA
jgi:4,5-dihydroxyphthalate decarboxylase